MTKKAHVLIMYGATGVGKSDLALALAQQVSAEIINMDIGSFYTPLTVGTAKPPWRDAAVPHHLFDIVDTPQNYTVTMYRAQCLRLIDEIHARGKVPLLVGGSGFYLKSLLFPPIVATDFQESHSEDTSDYNLPVQELWQQLYAIDADRALAIDQHDVYRIKRALSIWRQMGQKPSSYKPTFDFPYSFHLIHLYRNRAQLNTRINQRVEQMLASGWVQEVRNLCGTEWENFILDKKIIGYNDLVEYIRDGDNFEQVMVTIQKKTRSYAKRQVTFWRMLERIIAQELQGNKQIQGALDTIDLSLIESDLYAKHLLLRINNVGSLK